MPKFMNLNGPIVADTVYSENDLVARDVEFTLPEVAPVMADVEAMGTMSFPIWSRLDNMELSVTKIGLDNGLRALMKPMLKPLEFRFVQQIIDENGNSKEVGCKAFVKCMPTVIPGIGVVPGEASSNDTTHVVTRYQLFVGGKELFLIDRLACICKIDGVDYAKGTQSLL